MSPSPKKRFFKLKLLLDENIDIRIVIFCVHPPVISRLKSVLIKLLEKVAPEQFAGKTFLLSEEGIEVKK